MKYISQQLKWQRRKIEQGLCASCGKRPLSKENKRLCERCRAAYNRRQNLRKKPKNKT